jgi:hypothetical protein
MKKHFLNPTRSFLIGALGAIGSIGLAHAADSYSRIESLQFGETPTVYPGSSQAMPQGAQGPIRSEMVNEAWDSGSSGAVRPSSEGRSMLSWKHGSPRSELLAEQPTEYPAPAHE